MGYYSDVAISMTNKCYEDFLKKIKEYAERNNYTGYENQQIKEFLNNTYYGEQIKTDDGVILIWRDVKWYQVTDYIHISCIMFVLDRIKWENQYSYKFFRIGEDYSDIDYIEVYREEDENVPWIEISRELVY